MGALEGMVFCITGSLSMLRRDFENLLRTHGGSVRQRVNQDVSHLICADETTQKAQKAKQMGVALLSEAHVLDLLGLSSSSSSQSSTNDSNDNNSSGSKKRSFAETDSETDDDEEAAATKKARPNNNNNAVDDDDEVTVVKPPATLVDLSEEEDEEEEDTKPAAATAPAAAAAAARSSLADGEEMQVPGKEYKIKNVGGVYSCTCPAWRFQRKKIDVRTCKHIQEFRGAAAEAARIGGSNATKANTTTKRPNNNNSKTTKAAKASSPAAASSASSSSAAVLFDATKVTLAHTWDNAKHGPNASNYVMSEKLDGMRALWNGRQLVSRGGNPIDAPDFFLQGFPADTALDGELFMGRGKFQQLVSITRRHNGGDLWKQVKYVVFDSPTARGGFEQRLAETKRVVGGGDKMPYAEVLEHKPCRSEAHMQQELKTITGAGGEGLMMRLKGSDYPTGRSNKLLKVKTFQDDEGLVTEHQPGAGRHKGRMGALVCRLRNGKVFKVGTGFSDAQRENPPPVGSVVTVQFFELTNSGVPRFPSFLRVRKDVSPTEFD